MSQVRNGPPPGASRPFGGRGPMAGLGMPVEKALDFRISAKRLLGRLRPDAFRIAFVVLLAVISIGFNVLGPKILGEATDVIFNGVIGQKNGGPGIDFAKLRMWLFVAMALYASASAFGLLQGFILNGVVARVVYAMRSDVEDKLNRLPLNYYDTRTRGEVLSRVTNDIDNISQSLQQTLSQLLTSVLMVVGVLVMMFVISPLLAVIGLITVPISVVLTQQIAKRSQRMFVAQWRSVGELNGQIEETFTGHSLVKVFGRQYEVEEKFRAKNDEVYRASFGSQFVSGIIPPAMMLIGNINYVLLAVVGGLRVSSGAMTLGDAQAFIQYSRQFTQPLTQVASMANTLQSGVASAERVFELLDADEMSAEPAAVDTPSRAHGRVEFENVSFSYEAEKPLIHDLSLLAEPGQTVAIVGPTGAGKTTLVNLIMRFYEIQAGRITLDGRDIREMSRQQLRSNVGMVLQDTWLFAGTIRDNIAYGNLNATDDEIVAAAKATFVDRFVNTLPDGYDTLLDDEGTNVSAGEKQLLTIARAFLADPALLILDEATSSVDTRTELLVQRAMAALRSDRTSFVIAHRLSTIRDADLILVMDGGAIVEQGTHAELLAAGGAYFTLYNSQFAGGTEVE